MKIYENMPGIRARRRARGISVQQAADALGMSRQAWYYYETGVNMPAAALLPAIAELLGCTIEALYEAPEEGDTSSGPAEPPSPRGEGRGEENGNGQAAE